MLVLTRKQNEKIRIGDSITITVLRMKGKAVRLGIEAPHDISVIRGELCFDLDEKTDETPSDVAQPDAHTSVPPKSKPRATGKRTAIAKKTTSHWPVDSSDQTGLRGTRCSLPVGTSSLRAMIEART